MAKPTTSGVPCGSFGVRLLTIISQKRRPLGAAAPASTWPLQRPVRTTVGLALPYELISSIDVESKAPLRPSLRLVRIDTVPTGYSLTVGSNPTPAALTVKVPAKPPG